MEFGVKRGVGLKRGVRLLTGTTQQRSAQHRRTTASRAKPSNVRHAGRSPSSRCVRSAVRMDSRENVGTMSRRGARRALAAARGAHRGAVCACVAACCLLGGRRGLDDCVGARECCARGGEVPSARRDGRARGAGSVRVFVVRACRRARRRLCLPMLGVKRWKAR